MPTLTLRDWFTGSRPVAGAIGACSLMLLACSWFVLGPGELGRSRDVGIPAPVRIAGVASEPSASARPAHAAKVHTLGTRRHDATSILPRAPRRGTPPAATASVPLAQSAAPVAPSPPAQATTPTPTSSPATSQPAPVLPAGTTPTLPAPLDDVPEVKVPPVTVQVPAVPVPVLPLTVPAVTVTTPALGLP